MLLLIAMATAAVTPAKIRCYESGLTVSVYPDRRQPVVHVRAVSHGGHGQDPVNAPGAHHVAEHAWFRQSIQGVPVADLLMREGVVNNAHTNESRTSFEYSGPRSALDTILDVEAARTSTGLNGLEPALVDQELEIVETEVAQRFGLVRQTLHAAKGYHSFLPTVQAPGDTSKIEYDHVLAAAQDWTSRLPVIVVRGDVTFDAVEQQLVESFGPEATGEQTYCAKFRTEHTAPPKPDPRPVVVEAAVDEPYWMMSWNLQSKGIEGDTAYEAAAIVQRFEWGSLNANTPDAKPPKYIVPKDQPPSCSMVYHHNRRTQHCVRKLSGDRPTREAVTRHLFTPTTAKAFAGESPVYRQLFKMLITPHALEMAETSAFSPAFTWLGDYTDSTHMPLAPGQYVSRFSEIEPRDLASALYYDLNPSRAALTFVVPYGTDRDTFLRTGKYAEAPELSVEASPQWAGEVHMPADLTERSLDPIAKSRMPPGQEYVLFNGLKVRILKRREGLLTSVALFAPAAADFEWHHAAHLVHLRDLTAMGDGYVHMRTYARWHAPEVLEDLGNWVAALHKSEAKLLPNGVQQAKKIDRRLEGSLYSAQVHAVWNRLYSGIPMFDAQSFEDSALAFKNYPLGKRRFVLQDTWRPDRVIAYVVTAERPDAVLDMLERAFQNWTVPVGSAEPTAKHEPLPGPQEATVETYEKERSSQGTVLVACRVDGNQEVQRVFEELLESSLYTALRTNRTAAYTPQVQISRSARGDALSVEVDVPAGKEDAAHAMILKAINDTSSSPTDVTLAAADRLRRQEPLGLLGQESLISWALDGGSINRIVPESMPAMSTVTADSCLGKTASHIAYGVVLADGSR